MLMRKEDYVRTRQMENWLLLIKGIHVLNCCVGIFPSLYHPYLCHFNVSSQDCLTRPEKAECLYEN